MKGFEYFSLFITLFVFVVVIFIFTLSFLHYRKKKQNIISRGVNGIGGKGAASNVTMTCPVDSHIVVSQAQLICTNPAACPTNTDPQNPTVGSCENGTCDPFFQGANGQGTYTFNPATTMDVSSQLGTAANGKKTFTFTVPDASQTHLQNLCNGSPCTGQIQLIGTYSCYPNS